MPFSPGHCLHFPLTAGLQPFLSLTQPDPYSASCLSSMTHYHHLSVCVGCGPSAGIAFSSLYPSRVPHPRRVWLRVPAEKTCLASAPGLFLPGLLLFHTALSPLISHVCFAHWHIICGPGSETPASGHRVVGYFMHLGAQVQLRPHRCPFPLT